MKSDFIETMLWTIVIAIPIIVGVICQFAFNLPTGYYRIDNNDVFFVPSITTSFVAEGFWFILIMKLFGKRILKEDE